MVSLKHILVIIGAATLLLLSTLYFLHSSVFAANFVGPSQSGGFGSGAIGVDAANNLSMGTSTTRSDTKVFILASSTCPTGCPGVNEYSLRIHQPLGSPIFLVRNDGKILIATTTASGTVTIDGSLYVTQGISSPTGFSGQILAENVLPGVFNDGTGGDYAFNGSIGIGTSTRVGLPQGLDIYAGGILAQGTTGGTPASGAGTRLMWIPAKAAFRAGKVSASQWNDPSIGQNSAAFGEDSNASGSWSFAVGRVNTASGIASAALGGFNNVASGQNSLAGGESSQASGLSSIAFGVNASAGNTASLALGYISTANGFGSVAIGGRSATASGFESVAIGNYMTVTGSSSLGISLNTDAGPVTTLSQPYTMAIMGGNVGIGTVTPGAALEVNGDLRFTKEAARTFGIMDSTTANAVGATLNIVGAAATNGAANGGPINITGGAGIGFVFGGAVNINGGAAPGGIGGSVNIIPGGGGGYGNVIVAGPGGLVSVGTTTAPTHDLSIGGAIRLWPSTQPANGNGAMFYENSSNKFRCYENSTWVDCIGTLGASSTISARNVSPGIFGASTTLPNGDYAFPGAIYTTGTAAITPVSGSGTRMMWIPAKRAFRAGGVGGVNPTAWDDAKIGMYSTALGWNTVASGTYSFAAGFESQASGVASVAIGNQAYANGTYSVAMGFGATAGASAVAIGDNVNASGEGSVALGGGTGGVFSPTLAQSAASALALGRGARALGIDSFALNNGMEVNGAGSVGINLNGWAGGSASISANSVMAIMGGNVGLGTVMPSYRLDVTGDANVSGVYRRGGTAGTSTICASGEYLNAQNVAGGIVTGGTCAPVLLSGGASPRVAFWTGANSLGNDSSFLWDSANHRLTVGDSAAALGGHLTINASSPTGDSLEIGNAQGIGNPGQLRLIDSSGGRSVRVNSTWINGLGTTPLTGNQACASFAAKSICIVSWRTDNGNSTACTGTYTGITEALCATLSP